MRWILGLVSIVMYSACSDSYVATIDEASVLSDEDGDGFHAGEDCNDSNSDVNPDAVEVCDDIDNDCDELIDDEDDSVDINTGEMFYIDRDGDGYGDFASSVQACTPQIGMVDNSDDCDDLDSERHPGASEVHDDGIDQDCDGLNDDVPLHVFMLTGQSNMSGIDPADTFTPRLEEVLPSETIEVVHYAIGSRSIGYWDLQWPYPGEIMTTPGSMYEVLITRVLREVERDLTSVTLIWMQGESDASLGHANVYEESFLRVFNQIRTDLEFDDVNVVIGRINDCCNTHPTYPDWIAIREIQKDLGRSHHFDWVNTDDLNTVMGQNGEPHEALHLTPMGYEILGTRFADAALDMLIE